MKTVYKPSMSNALGSHKMLHHWKLQLLMSCSELQHYQVHQKLLRIQNSLSVWDRSKSILKNLFCLDLSWALWIQEFNPTALNPLPPKGFPIDE